MMIKMFIWQSFLKPHKSRAQKDSRTEDGAKPIIAPWVKKMCTRVPLPTTNVCGWWLRCRQEKRKGKEKNAKGKGVRRARCRLQEDMDEEVEDDEVDSESSYESYESCDTN
jgi:hypothetical protein